MENYIDSQIKQFSCIYQTANDEICILSIVFDPSSLDNKSNIKSRFIIIIFIFIFYFLALDFFARPVDDEDAGALLRFLDSEINES